MLGLIVFGVVIQSSLRESPERSATQISSHPSTIGMMLPAWVQTTRSSPLWHERDEAAISTSTLAPYALLRVHDASGARLRVSSADAPDQGGWVDVRSVQPSDPPGRWLVTRSDTMVFAAAEGPDATMPSLSAGAYLRIAGTALGDRIPVEIEPREGSAARGWVEISRVEAASRPDRLVVTAGLPPLIDRRADRATSRDDFLRKVSDVAIESQRTTRVPASVTVAQAILESNWGESGLSIRANNYFGIKATGRIGPAGVIWMPTSEVVDGKIVSVTEPFRVYHSLVESIDDHAALFTGARRYADAMTIAHRPLDFAVAIQKAGYSTDPAYATKLSRLIQQYDLARLDTPSTAEKLSFPD